MLAGNNCWSKTRAWSMFGGCKGICGCGKVTDGNAALLFVGGTIAALGGKTKGGKVGVGGLASATGFGNGFITGCVVAQADNKLLRSTRYATDFTNLAYTD